MSRSVRVLDRYRPGEVHCALTRRLPASSARRTNSGRRRAPDPSPRRSTGGPRRDRARCAGAARSLRAVARVRALRRAQSPCASVRVQSSLPRRASAHRQVIRREGAVLVGGCDGDDGDHAPVADQWHEGGALGADLGCQSRAQARGVADVVDREAGRLEDGARDSGRLPDEIDPHVGPPGDVLPARSGEEPGRLLSCPPTRRTAPRSRRGRATRSRRAASLRPPRRRTSVQARLRSGAGSRAHGRARAMLPPRARGAWPSRAHRREARSRARPGPPQRSPTRARDRSDRVEAARALTLGGWAVDGARRLRSECFHAEEQDACAFKRWADRPIVRSHGEV